MFKALAIFLSVAAASLTPHDSLAPRQATNKTADSQIVLIAGPGFIKSMAYNGEVFSPLHNFTCTNCYPMWLCPNYKQSTFHLADGNATNTTLYGLNTETGKVSDTGATEKGKLSYVTRGSMKSDSKELIGTTLDFPNYSVVWYDTAPTNTSMFTLKLKDGVPITDPPRSGKDWGHVASFQIIFEPQERYFVVPVTGADILLVVDPKTHRFIHRQATPAGCSPRHGAFWTPADTEATYLVVICEDSNLVLLYDVDYGLSAPIFTLVQSASTWGAGFNSDLRRDTKAQDILIAEREPRSSSMVDEYVSSKHTGAHDDYMTHFHLMYDGEIKRANLVFNTTENTYGSDTHSMALGLKGTRLFLANLAAKHANASAVVVYKRDPKTGILSQPHGKIPYTDFAPFRNLNETGMVPMQGAGFIMPWESTVASS